MINAVLLALILDPVLLALILVVLLIEFAPRWVRYVRSVWGYWRKRAQWRKR